MISSQRKDLRVLLVDDDLDVTEAVAGYLRSLGYDVECAGDLASAAGCISKQTFDLAILDLNLPDGSGFTLLQTTARGRVRHFVVLTGHGSVKVAVEALRYQVFDFLIKPIDLAELCNVIARASAGIVAQSPAANAPAEAAPAGNIADIMIGVSPAIRQAHALLDRAARSDITVFLQGESGTGKEVAAQCLHRLSHRAGKPFIAFNCGAVSPFLAASELFGHEKGSFTGASNARRGIFERAGGGTLFLDEITEMPLDLQASLLRVLETGTIVRVGGDRELQVDVRIIAATNCHPERSVEQQRFRLDLYYRLQVFPVMLPPLRERREDVPVLAHHFLARFNANAGAVRPRHFSAEAMTQLVQHHWPGNVRELRNTVDRSCLLSNEVIEPEHLRLPPPSARPIPKPATAGMDIAPPPLQGRGELEIDHILRVLRECNGNRTRAAARLGVSVRTLYNRLKQQPTDESNGS